MGRITNTLKLFFEPLSPAQRMIFALLAIVLVLFLSMVFYWSLKPDYALLFGSLPADTAREITQELEEQGVDYRIEDGGRSIYVHSDQVHALRMQVASRGFSPQSGTQGYELFDANTLGMTDFMQRINKKRALEGELARTINSLEQVDHSRIHLVLPERTPFQQTSVQASASIILTLKRGQALAQPQVEGMISLVAGSVEGLEPGAITVLDQNGNRLSDGLALDGDYSSGSTQMQLRQKSEAYITERGQSMLDRVLGPGNSILRVAVEHDFDRITRESDLIDPDSRTIISEERRSESLNDNQFQHIPVDEFTPLERRGETVMTANRGNESTIQTRNYEVNKIREFFEKPQGEIRRISASLLLNYKTQVDLDENGDPARVNVPYSAEELDELREVMRTALGIQVQRGDELVITQIEFFDPMATDPYQRLMDQPIPWNLVLRWVLIIAALMVFAALMYNISRRWKEDRQLILFDPLDSPDQMAYPDQDFAGGSRESMENADPDLYEKKLSEEARKQIEEKTVRIDEIRDFVEVQPEDAANVVRTMLKNA